MPESQTGVGKRLGIAALSILAAILVYFILPTGCPEPARRVAGIFVLAALFWGFEIIPLFATSLLVLLLLIFNLAGSNAADAGSYRIFFLPFSNPVIVLFLGGFALARVLQKHGIDRVAVFRLLQAFGHRPYSVLCGFILATAFLSLWMSHTAATALMLALVIPVLKHLEADDPFKKALVLAIPFSANIGSIGTPVGTPPNAIALGILKEHGIEVHFLSWMLMAVPLALILLVFTSGILYFMFRPKRGRMPAFAEPVQTMGAREKWAAGIALLTILLWITSGWHQIPEAVVSLLAVTLFAGFGFLTHDDLNALHWDILILMWGGLALGHAMETSGLGAWAMTLPLFAQQGFGLVLTFCLLTVAISIFISNTPTANLLVPLAMSAPEGERLLLAIVVALSASFDMLLPVSTPSNALAFSTRVVAVRDMVKAGLPIVVLAVVLVLAGHRFFITGILGRG